MIVRVAGGARPPYYRRHGVALGRAAQRFRRWYQTRILESFKEVDTRCCHALDSAADRIHAGRTGPAREPRYFQPLSIIGLPLVAVPVLLIAVQIVAVPWREDVARQIAYALDQKGSAKAGGAISIRSTTEASPHGHRPSRSRRRGEGGL